jgi:hypothetical protein
VIRWSPDEKSLIELITPGLILLASILIIIWDGLDEPSRKWWCSIAINADQIKTPILLSGAILIVLVSMFLGFLLSVLVGYIEAKVYDRITWCKLRLDEEAYYKQWKRYVHSLDGDGRNSYISQVFTNFRREVRLGVALIPLAFTLTSLSVSFWIVFSLLFISTWLLYTAHHDHHILGEYRMDRPDVSTASSGVQQID